MLTSSSNNVISLQSNKKKVCVIDDELKKNSVQSILDILSVGIRYINLITKKP